MNYLELPELPENYHCSLGMTYDEKKFVHCLDIDLEKEVVVKSVRYFMDFDEPNQVFGLTLEGEKVATHKLTGKKYWELMKKEFPEYFRR